MTDICIIYEADKTDDKDKVVGVCVEGHSGYGPEDGDILCASISTAMHVLESGVRGYLGIPCSVKQNKEKGQWDIQWEIQYASHASPFAETVVKVFESLAEQYSDFVSIDKLLGVDFRG